MIGPGTAVVTGASGYLGSRICDALSARAWKIVRLVRSPSPDVGEAFAYDIAAPVSDEVRLLLRSADALIHAAYDFTVTSRADIWRTNVEGTRRLLREAQLAGVPRILVLSSMSAYAGTTQLYGQAKLEIERDTIAAGGCAIRPGVVIGPHPGGMAGALEKLTRLPIAPIISGNPRQYVVREADLMTVVATLLAVEELPPVPVGVAHSSPVTLRELLETLRPKTRRQPYFVPVPWQVVYAILRAGETLRIAAPFRADSLLGLVHAAPDVPGRQYLAQLGVTPQPVLYRNDPDERQSPQATTDG